ncbi:MAG: hypothetical protein CVV52_12200 [Spirochaetae bacterium HGW-Spirochaetae-8]|nr:MAG: hypothetical protein CVV52_12200 [Spirochaetae bacterium HGW-Spirochaetae-8]
MRQESSAYQRMGLVSGGVLLELFVSTQLGLWVMLVGVLLGLPVLVNVILLVGSIAAVLYICSAEILYSVDDSGLTRSIRPTVLKSTRLSRREHIKWERIVWYTVDHDRNRSWQAYPYLLIKGKEPPFRWKIAGKNMQDAAFDQFVESVIQCIPLTSLPRSGTPTPHPQAHPDNPSSASSPTAMPVIQSRRGFYRTKWAKGLAVLFLTADLLLIGGVLTGGIALSATSTYRLIAVLLPGTAYVLYRTFRN